MENEKKLGVLNVAVMYIGCIMGAGFASGRETWQFFGVFGKNGIIGVVIFAVLFLLTGLVINYNSVKLNSSDIGAVIVPGNSTKWQAFIGYFMAGVLFLIMVAMSAAGGALLNQQFGLPYFVGGIIITILAVATILGDFERISGVFKFVMPVLCIIMIGISIVVLKERPMSGMAETEILPSPIASNWLLATVLYVAYNVTALISIVANASIRAKTKKTAVIGNISGGIFLGILAMLILITVQIDPTFSQSADMPVLGYAGMVSKPLGIIYTLIMFCAIYSAATSNFYGFTTKIKAGKNKNKKIIIASIFAYGFGLMGFKNFVSYISPLIGCVGLVMIVLMVINAITLSKEKKTENE